MTTVDADKTTTWGDCPNPDCILYGRMMYGIEPGDICEGNDRYPNSGCGNTLRWWDRWHDGEHRGERGITVCEANRVRP